MNSVRLNNLRLKYQMDFTTKLKRYRNSKIRVCGKNWIPLFGYTLWIQNICINISIIKEVMIRNIKDLNLTGSLLLFDVVGL